MIVIAAVGLLLIFISPSLGQSAGDRAINRHGGSMDTAQYERVIEETTTSIRLGGAILALTGGAGIVTSSYLLLRSK